MEIALPPGMPQAYLDLVKTKIDELVSHRCDESRHWIETLAELEKQGWLSTLHVHWVIEARRSACLERAEGGSLCEAVEALRQLTMLNEIENCP